MCGAFAAALLTMAWGNGAVLEKINMVASTKLVETNWAPLLL